MPTTITPGGDFSCAELLQVQLNKDAVWADSIDRREYEPKIDALNCLAQNSSVTISALEDPTKRNTVKIYWPSFCADTLIDCPTDKCAIPTLPEANTGCAEYELDCLRGAGFKVPHNVEFKSSELSMDAFVAKAMMRVEKQLSEYVAQQFIASLNAEAGTNVFDPIVSGGDANEIPASYWTPSLMAYFTQVADYNDFSDWWMLSGQNLFSSLWHAGMNSGNADGAGQAAMASQFPICFDTRNVDGTNGTDKCTYLINRNSIVWSNTYCYNLNTPTAIHTRNVGTRVEWAAEMSAIPGTYLDWTRTTVCEEGQYFDEYYATLTGGFLHNPIGCDADKTGILRFCCV